jgi:hypothetical protein
MDHSSPFIRLRLPLKELWHHSTWKPQLISQTLQISFAVLFKNLSGERLIGFQLLTRPRQIAIDQ